MALSPELADLKIRCIKALQIGASLARIDEHMAKIGVAAPPSGVPKERHFLAYLDALGAGNVPEDVEPEAAEPEAAEPEKDAEPEPEPEVGEEEPEPEDEEDAEDEDVEGDALEEEDAKETTPEKVAAAPKKKSGKKSGKKK